MAMALGRSVNRSHGKIPYDSDGMSILSVLCFLFCFSISLPRSTLMCIPCICTTTHECRLLFTTISRFLVDSTRYVMRRSSVVFQLYNNRQTHRTAGKRAIRWFRSGQRNERFFAAECVCVRVCETFSRTHAITNGTNNGINGVRVE